MPEEKLDEKTELEETSTQETDASTEKEEKKEESNVPSWRLREETEKRKKAEEDLEALRAERNSTSKVEKEIDPKDIRGMLRKRLKPIYNSETGEWETSDEALETIGLISERIASNRVDVRVKPIMERLSLSAIREQKAELRNLPHFKELESEIDKLLAKMPIEQRMQEGSVMAVYKYAIGEKTIADSQSKANEKPKIDGDINPTRSSNASTITSQLKKLSAEQLAELDKTWKAKGFDEEDYLDLLNRMIEQDKSKGFKTKRTLIDQKVIS